MTKSSHYFFASIFVCFYGEILDQVPQILSHLLLKSKEREVQPICFKINLTIELLKVQKIACSELKIVYPFLKNDICIL